jgi:hypothetical protein
MILSVASSTTSLNFTYLRASLGKSFPLLLLSPSPELTKSFNPTELRVFSVNADRIAVNISLLINLRSREKKCRLSLQKRDVLRAAAAATAAH